MAMGVPIFEKLLMFPILYPNLWTPSWFPKITGMVSLDINGKHWRNDYFQFHPTSGKISYRYQRHLRITLK